jgi:hypothetical protein
MPKVKKPTRAQVLKRAKEKDLQFVDYENGLWLICPSGKVFDMGDADSHCQFFEYGTKRSEFMEKALDSENWHAMCVPDFFPSTKTEAYEATLEWMDRRELIDCTEPDCDQCYLRANRDLVPLMRYFCVATFGPQVDIPRIHKSPASDTETRR